MKIDEHLLKFPNTLPNDLEGFIWYYPEKFPPIVDYFEEVAPKIATDAQAFRDYGNWARKELGEAFEKVKSEYEKGDQTDLAFLLSIDERFQKMYCYRFWIVNYLFPDGPFHDYIVDNLKNLIRKFTDVADDVEDFEQRVVSVQRDLLQSDYADLYLQQALEGVKAYELLQETPGIQELMPEVTRLIDNHDNDDVPAINAIWTKVHTMVTQDPNNQALREVLSAPLEQNEMRGSLLPFFNMLTHSVEFREENKKLASRHNNMGSVIDKYRDIAREKLTAEELEMFELCYAQARNFTEYKDVMGSIDPVLLPLWFSLHQKIREILMANNPDMTTRPTGPSAVYHHFIWYLPAELKARVMTPDFKPFKLEEI